MIQLLSKHVCSLAHIEQGVKIWCGSNASPRSSMLITMPSRFKTPVKASLVNFEP